LADLWGIDPGVAAQGVVNNLARLHSALVEGDVVG
jgi:hypothetical protein